VIEIRIPEVLRSYTNGAVIVFVEAGPVSSVADAIAAADALHPGLADRLLDEAGLRRFLNVYVSGADIRFGESLGTALRDTDSVVILPATAGAVQGNG